MITCTILLTACGKEKVQMDVDVATLEQSTLGLISIIGYEGTADQLAAYDSYEQEMLETVLQDQGLRIASNVLLKAATSFEESLEEMGEIAEMGAPVTEVTEDEAIVTIPMTASQRNAEVVVIYNDDTEVTSVTMNVEYSFGELMSKAGLNTLLGMGSVFGVLILIMFIISAFKYISIFEEKAKNKKNDKVKMDCVEQTISNIVEQEDTSASDYELVAVIAAAIAASEGATSTDGFVVRSIRKHK